MVLFIKLELLMSTAPFLEKEQRFQCIGVGNGY
jgi:hypothetical protein